MEKDKAQSEINKIYNFYFDLKQLTDKYDLSFNKNIPDLLIKLDEIIELLEKKNFTNLRSKIKIIEKDFLIDSHSSILNDGVVFFMSNPNEDFIITKIDNIEITDIDIANAPDIDISESAKFDPFSDPFSESSPTESTQEQNSSAPEIDTSNISKKLDDISSSLNNIPDLVDIKVSNYIKANINDIYDKYFNEFRNLLASEQEKFNNGIIKNISTSQTPKPENSKISIQDNKISIITFICIIAMVFFSSSMLLSKINKTKNSLDELVEQLQASQQNNHIKNNHRLKN